MSRAERETVIRWDCEDRMPVMYTADPAQARRWTRLGYAVSVTDAARDGSPSPKFRFVSMISLVSASG